MRHVAGDPRKQTKQQIYFFLFKCDRGGRGNAIRPWARKGPSDRVSGKPVLSWWLLKWDRQNEKEICCAKLGRESKEEGFKTKKSVYSLGRAVRMKLRKDSSSSRLPERPLRERCLQSGVGVKGRVFGRKWGEWVQAVCVSWSRGGWAWFCYFRPST